MASQRMIARLHERLAEAEVLSAAAKHKPGSVEYYGPDVARWLRLIRCAKAGASDREIEAAITEVEEGQEYNPVQLRQVPENVLRRW